MTPEQIEILYKASQTKFLSDEDRKTLQLDNPYARQGKVAEALQSEVARIAPLQARLWAKEAGAKLSLEAAAAQAGLTEMTPAIQSEINRLQPQTEDEAKRQMIAELTANGNPFSKKQSYDEKGRLQPAPYSLTAAMQIEMADPALAARLKKEANPEPVHNFTDREAQIMSRHGFQLPSN